MEKLVIALGGNALQEGKGPATAEAQLAVVEKTAKYIADIIEGGYQVVLAHGNGRRSAASCCKTNIRWTSRPPCRSTYAAR